MSLTKVTDIVLDDDITVNTINGAEISIIAKPNAIPKATSSGILDPSWGTSGGGGSGGDMYRATYDTNSNGIVDRSEKADAMTAASTANKFWGTNATNVQEWQDPATLLLTKSVYDPTNSGKVTAAVTADKLVGNPAANKLWGTNSVGVQGWIDTTNGDMAKAVYDTNNDGRVDHAEIAYGLANPAANRIWGTTSAGVQQWFAITPSDIMVKSEYGESATVPSRVAVAVQAISLSSETGAGNNTVYSKNETGVVGWVSLSTVVGDAMLKSEYGYKNNGVDIPGRVAEAQVALNLMGADAAGNEMFYATNIAGTPGWYSINDYTSIMFKTDFVDSGTKVKSAKTADTLQMIELAKGNTSQPYSILGVVNNEWCNFTNIEQFIQPSSCIKSNWCGFIVDATGNASDAVFSNEEYNSNSTISMYGYSTDGNLVVTSQNIFAIHTNKLDYNGTSTGVVANADVYIRATFYTTTTGTAQLNVNGTAVSPIANSFVSVPLKIQANDIITLYVSGDDVFKLYLEIC